MRRSQYTDNDSENFGMDPFDRQRAACVVPDLRSPYLVYTGHNTRTESDPGKQPAVVGDTRAIASPVKGCPSIPPRLVSAFCLRCRCTRTVQARLLHASKYLAKGLARYLFWEGGGEAHQFSLTARLPQW